MNIHVTVDSKTGRAKVTFIDGNTTSTLLLAAEDARKLATALNDVSVYLTTTKGALTQEPSP